jgi:hypothetical protein
VVPREGLVNGYWCMRSTLVRRLLALIANQADGLYRTDGWIGKDVSCFPTGERSVDRKALHNPGKGEIRWHER